MGHWFLAFVAFAVNALREFCQCCIILSLFLALLCAMEQAASDHWKRYALSLPSALDRDLCCRNSAIANRFCLGLLLARNTTKNADVRQRCWLYRGHHLWNCLGNAILGG